MIEIKVGDKVKFLNDTGEGCVVALIDRDMVLVRTDQDGFEYPVLKKELLVKKAADTSGDIPDQERLSTEEDSWKDLESGEAFEAGEVSVDAPKEIRRKEEKKKKETKEKKKSAIEEVDLHIGQIIDDTEGLSSGEIVEIQLARFRTALEGAIKAKQKRIIFIHGKGAGKLKYEIEKIIKNEYNKSRFQDASFREYGFGATLVLIN